MSKPLRKPTAPQLSPEMRSFGIRMGFVLFVVPALACVVLWRALYLQWINQDFLEKRGNDLSVRVAKVVAHRGSILDRFGEPLAVSTPVDSVIVNPRELLAEYGNIKRLAEAVGREQDWLKQRLAEAPDRQGLPIGVMLEPGQSAALMQMKIPGVTTERQYRRYYPAGEVVGHVLGFNSREDHGQEGLELDYDQSLGGEDGAKRVQRDRLGRIVKDIASIKTARPGVSLETSIDLRVQYLAYRALKSAVQEAGADSGSVVVLDVTTGEVLAMANQPAFNPNDRSQFRPDFYRNRAAMDVMEPGSTVKPFVVASGLQGGTLTPASLINVADDVIVPGRKPVSDEHHVDSPALPATILAKSSNRGIVRIALAQPKEDLWNMLTGVGFGQGSASGFPGESAGILPPLAHWRLPTVASLSYGYGLNTTPLQLASAYATLAAGGVRRPVTFRRVDGSVRGERVMDETVAREVVGMLEHVVSADGTAQHAAIEGYRVSGKTGTALVSGGAAGYQVGQYDALFAGMVPTSNPRLAAVVVIRNPRSGRFYGGEVSAPVFAEIMSGAVRLMGIPPDNLAGIKPGTLLQAAAP
jgi:cell division protein FtsI (penicillin-binding protein 3)